MMANSSSKTSESILLLNFETGDIIMKSVLITGASRGLGYCLAEKYAAKGFYVIACARNINSEKLKNLKITYKDSIQLVAMDVSDDKSVEKAAEEVKQSIQALDIIINNAGVHFNDTDNELESVNLDHCLETFNINTLGALRVSKAFVSLLEDH